jgi:hypothetical protein
VAEAVAVVAEAVVVAVVVVVVVVVVAVVVVDSPLYSVRCMLYVDKGLKCCSLDYTNESSFNFWCRPAG